MGRSLRSGNARTNPGFLDTAASSPAVSLAANPDTTLVYECRTRRWTPALETAGSRNDSCHRRCAASSPSECCRLAAGGGSTSTM
nr:unnamed protein product [Digitaria exilis]